MNLLNIDLNSVEYIQAWIRSVWPTLAASAYGHFIDSGRGALAINLRDAATSDDFILGRRAKLGYLTAEAIAAEGVKFQELYKMVNEYDPETQAVMFIARKGSPLNVQVSGGISPVQAFEEHQASVSAVPYLGPVNFG